MSSWGHRQCHVQGYPSALRGSALSPESCCVLHAQPLQGDSLAQGWVPVLG